MMLVSIAKYFRIIVVASVIYTLGYWMGVRDNCNRLTGLMYAQSAESVSSRIELERTIAFLMVRKQQVNSLVVCLIPLLFIVMYCTQRIISKSEELK